MSISASPLERIADTPVLGAVFSDVSIKGYDAHAGNDNSASESEHYDFIPGARSLKDRIITAVPEKVEAIADDVLYELEQAGFEKDAQEFKAILSVGEIEPPKPKATAEQAHSVLSFG